MKKSTVNTLLIVGAAAAAWFIFTAMRKRRGSSVEAGPTIKQTEAEFEAEVVPEAPAQPTFVKGAQSVIDIFKGLKRTTEQKAAAERKKAMRIEARSKRAENLRKKKAAKKVGEISILY